MKQNEENSLKKAQELTNEELEQVNCFRELTEDRSDPLIHSLSP